ncbi:hypothetical protein GCM10011390_42140 [Aureimonas endophytica]|uniref:Uncharacterized protein n=1 Tax=Aureimonas endophytica TaxID=2027858 RepID=A0A916ZZ39_9HYPH|nr:hypothetical protein [Aureimonas endophytica]GGE18534.1 hypothetical protein GCM10011390_42140 [Aureimonas endophytica]
MTDRIYVLRQDGREIARHSTRRACVVEAMERGLVVHVADTANRLIDGVTISEKPGNDR